MSDALCGPSNALQNFQKHASVDRTLQQDRLISRQSPSQGFRSQNFSDGALDPEFAAFGANIAGPSLPDIQHARPFMPPNPQLSMPSHVVAPDWAADFQNLQISGPSHPVAQHQRSSAAPLKTVTSGGWQNEFVQQQQQHQRPLANQRLQPYQSGFQPSFAPSFPLHGATANVIPAPQEVTAEHQAPTEVFDESAFEAAFEQARADMESLESSTTHENVEIAKEPIQPEATETKLKEQIKIGSDTIPYADKEDSSTRLNDADELAKTAGQLLDSVSHDQSQKFKESNFLALMRRIRDREVQVEGDEFRETAQPLHPGGKYYPEQHRALKSEYEGTESRITADDLRETRSETAA